MWKYLIFRKGITALNRLCVLLKLHASCHFAWRSERLANALDSFSIIWNFI